jgi:hypothetical protein
MNKNILNIIYLVIMLFEACNTSEKLANKTFSYKSKHRLLEFVFNNDSICTLKNTFYCKKIDSNIEEISSVCKYKRSFDTIYFKNIDCKSNDCIYDLFRQIPSQQSTECSFLTKKERDINVRIGGNYVKEFDKFGLIPNIDIDTAYIIKGKILFFKGDKEHSMTFIFK